MLSFAVMIIFIVVFGIFVPEAVGFADVDVLLFATAVIDAVVSVVVVFPDAAAPADIVVLLFAAMIVVIVVFVVFVAFVVIVLDAKSSSVVVTSVVETARVQRHTGAAFCVRQRLSDLLPFVSSRYFRYPKELPLELK